MINIHTIYVLSDTIILEKIVLHNATAITVAKIRIIITTIFLSPLYLCIVLHDYKFQSRINTALFAFKSKCKLRFYTLIIRTTT